jgi:hypothetical protein
LIDGSIVWRKLVGRLLRKPELFLVSMIAGSEKGVFLMAIKRNAAGKIVAKKFSLPRLEAAREASMGFCLACGAEAEQVEPDARKYSCARCGLAHVYGAEEIALRQFI